MVDDNGFLFDPHNIEDLAKKLDVISNLTKEKISKMKQLSYEMFVKNFSGKLVSEKINNLIKIVNADNI